MTSAIDEVDPVAVEEIILQSYLFAGFPRALNAARAWRTVSERAAPTADEHATVDDLEEWRERGEETCRVVYGDMYERLRDNIRELHPALDEWMIIDGYGKVLSRPYVDLRTRELCVVAACATSGQQRQLHSHLHGALNAGSTAAEIGAVLDALNDLISRDDLARYKQLLAKVVAG
ncbi:MAG TPA: carboxymuconolactone decarboxylase family protein [Gemmatimonadaceae bacterium]|nr:carboxymuconolactone decarboxylase family protein [Gemmatimonadaceae bacterium]